MLFRLSSLIVFAGLSISLWLAAYLLARGYTSRITWRAVLILVALAVSFYSTYGNLYHPVPGSSVWRATWLSLALAVWYDLVEHLAAGRESGRPRYKVWIAYGLGALNIALLWLSGDLYPGLRGDFLWTPHAAPSLIYLWYASFLIVAFGAIFYEFYRLWRAGSAPQHRFFFLSTCLAAATVVGFVVQLAPWFPAMPRLLQDSLMLASVSLFGYAVARHQAMVERRTTVQDFPLSGLTVLGLASLYAILAVQRDLTPEEVAGLTVLAVVTHSSVDLVREFLDRLLHRQDGALRQQLRRLARNVGGEETLRQNLRRALAILCQRWRARGGLVALKRGDVFEVVVSWNARPVGTHLTGAMCEDLCRPGPADSEAIAWLAPAFAGSEQVGVFGLGWPRNNRREYTERELDALAEAADWLGLLIANHQRQEVARKQLTSLAHETQTREFDLQTGPEELSARLPPDPDPKLVPEVEHALRHLHEYAVLAESPLVARFGLGGGGHLERGKAVRERLIQALECLRPIGERPRVTISRAWYGYIILHDAYVDDVPNREIMGQLYIGEGNFNRARRNALRSLARTLDEMVSSPVLDKPGVQLHRPSA
jgi:hypothetical protein